MISYAGVRLLMDGNVGDDDMSPNIRNWVRGTIPLQQHFAAIPGPTVDRWATVSQRDYFDHTPELNTLWWPTGGTRWAQGWFLATQEMAEACIEASWSGGTPGEATLILGDQLVSSIAAEMYLLPPVPLAWVSGEKQLYLLPLVDGRYFWRWLHVPQEAVNVREDGGNTVLPDWAHLYEQCRDQLGGASKLKQSLSTSLMADEFQPGDYPEYCAIDAMRTDDPLLPRHRTVSEVLELIAINTGRVLVRDFDGTNRLLTWPDSTSRHATNVAKSFSRIAGLDAFTSNAFASQVGGMYPETLVMAFPARHEESGRVIGEGWYTTSTTLGGLSGTELHISNQMVAQYDDNEVIANQDDVDAVAATVAADIITASGKYLDTVFAHICEYDPTGWSDTIEFRCCHDECTTRVRSRPWNWFPSQLNHANVDDPRPLQNTFEAVLTETMTRGGTSEATIYNGTTDTGDTIDVVDMNTKIPDDVTLSIGNSITVYQEGSKVNIGYLEGGTAEDVKYVLLSFDCDDTV